MARKYGDRLSVFAVSPGASSSTNASRNMTGIKKSMFARVMPLLGPSLGMDQLVEISAGRYVDVLNSPNGEFANGKSYMSKPKKMVGPLEETTNAHLNDIERQEVAWDVISELTDTAHELDAQAATPHRDLS